MDTTRNLFWVGICHPMVPVGTMWGGRDCRVQKLFCYIWKMVMATEELFHYLLSSKRDGRVGMELTRMADGHPIITQQLFGRFWCGLRESSAMPAQQTRRWILPFLPLQLQVIYCTRGYREDVYNGMKPAQPPTAAVVQGSALGGSEEREFFFSPAWLCDLTSHSLKKNFFKICALFFLVTSLPLCVIYIKSACKYFQKGFQDRSSKNMWWARVLDVPIYLLRFIQVLITLVGLNEPVCAAAFLILSSHPSFSL